MTTDAVRSLIREVLAEELGRLTRERGAKPSPTREVVSIKSDGDLQNLVQHIVKITGNKSIRDRIVRGEHVFVLDNSSGEASRGEKSTAAPSISSALTAGEIVQIKEGFLSERRVETLPAGTRVVQLGRGVRFTPLARDRLRQRKIAVERMK